MRYYIPMEKLANNNFWTLKFKNFQVNKRNTFSWYYLFTNKYIYKNTKIHIIFPFFFSFKHSQVTFSLFHYKITRLKSDMSTLTNLTKELPCSFWWINGDIVLRLTNSNFNKRGPCTLFFLPKIVSITISCNDIFGGFTHTHLTFLCNIFLQKGILIKFYCFYMRNTLFNTNFVWGLSADGNNLNCLARKSCTNNIPEVFTK